MITAARLREVVNYDPATGEFYWLIQRGPYRAGDQVLGHLTQHGYRQIFIDGSNYHANRLAFRWMTGEWPEHDVDHKDRNRLNNRWKNLRPATRSQNCANQIARRTNKLGVKGVHQVGQKFRATILVHGKRIDLGRHHTVAAASAAYEAAADKYFGEFARAA